MAQIVTARRVVSMMDGGPPAFAVQGEWIVGAGDVDGLRGRFPGAEVVDFGDAVVVPGFNDAHQHPTMSAEDLLHADLSGARSRSAVLATLRDQAARTPAGQWVRASRYDHAKATGGTILTRSDLDEAAPDHPVLVVHVAAHWGVLNSAGLAAAGLTDASAPPPGGDLGRDGSGALNGIVYEQALFDLAYPSLSRRPAILPAGSAQDRRRALREALRRLNAAGITSAGDAMVGPDELRLLQDARDGGEMTVRINALVTYNHIDTFHAAGLRTGFGDDWLRVGGVKSFVDGAVAGGTCLIEEPFAGTDDHGIQTLSTAELSDLVRRVHLAGSRLAVHANGDRAIRLLLDAFEAADREHPRPGPRHRIEHCTMVAPDIVERIRRLGVIAVPFGEYVHHHGDKLVGYYGKERLERMFAHRTLLDAGIPVAGSSDYPCGPYEPLLALASCVTREAADGTVLGGSQRISTVEALGLYTTGSAFAEGRDAVKGRLAPGYLADFTVLADDPLRTDPHRLPDIPVLQTWVGGRRVWEAG